ncbi:MAG: nucleotidyltransferase family protein [bacterium]|nr:nucleotidyltransferase family protein [bacterium]
MIPELKDIRVIILAGGLGTRLRPVISDIPKVLAPIGDKTALDYIMSDLLQKGFRNIVLSVGYMKEKIREHIRRQSFSKDVTIKFSEEESPLGTGGAIKKALHYSSSDMTLIVNGDTFFPIDYSRFAREHVKHDADISIALRKVNDVSKSGAVQTDAKKRITSFNEKLGESKVGTINGGIYLFKKNILDNFDLPEIFSIEKDFFEKYIDKIKAYGFIFSDYFIDIGTPENYEKARDDLQNNHAFC